MQQFLIDLDARSSSKQIVKHLTNDEDSNVHHSIGLNEIEEFWNDYMQTIPNDLELIWDTIINGLLRYLQVYYQIKDKTLINLIYANYFLFRFSQILKKRRKQIYECNFLRQQNGEISHLLQQYSDKH